MSPTLPVAITCDFWNTLVQPVEGVLSDLRSRAVAAVLRSHAWSVPDAVLEARLAAAGRLQTVAWEAGAAFAPADAARALADGLGLHSGQMRDELCAAYLDAGARVRLPVAAGADRALKLASDAGIKLAVVCDVGLTGAAHLRSLLEREGLLRHFDGWAFSDEIGHFKPSPVIFARALAGIGVDDPAGCLHVGDLRRTDVAGARAAGLIPVRYRGLSDDAGDGPEADHVISHWDELAALLAAAGPVPLDADGPAR